MGAMLVVLLALLLLLLGLAGMVFVYPMVRYAKERKMVSLIPGPAPRNMFLGNIPDFPARHLRPRHFLKMAQDYGHLGVVRLYLGPKPVLQVVGPQVAREIFAGSKHSTKSFIYDSLHPWLGMGLLTASGDKWKLMRRLTTPAFHFDVLRRFLDVMNEQADVLVGRAQKKAMEGGGNIEVFELITACALDIICETAMGKRVNAQGEEGPNEYVEAVYEMSRCVIYRFERPWLANDVIYSLTSNGRLHNRLLSTLHGFTNRVIAERKKLLQEQGEELLQRRPAFLDILLQAQQRGEPISDENIREEVDTFMFEGHDTTSASMAWTLQLLGTHPEIQERLYQEVEEVVGESQHLTNEMLGQLKYLDMVLKESLRLYPSVPGIGRELTEDIEIGNSVISKGTSVGVSLFTLHHHPKYWDDPERFWPERWLPENSEGRDPYLYVPFSAGARNCIGQKFASNEEKVVISKFIRQFRFESLEQDPMFLPELILRPANGIHIKVFPRKG